MKKIIISMVLSSLSMSSLGFEIFALGTSNTNCKNSGQAYTTRLNELLAQDKINANVINAGVDGDRPAFMMTRLEQGLVVYPNTKMVIFEPGPNEKNPRFSLGPSEEILAYLKKLNIPTIYVSTSVIQSDEEAQELATKYGAYYYGHWNKNIPTDSDHRLFDMPGGGGGHMTVVGCQKWAQYMLPTIKQVMKEKNIK
ncbi:hypothetical protein FD961_09335 [Polynucleobacter sp. TSB-Sco08W16]|uniref:SGNH/GDSL hydrolase family protein n=1 Tax=Polynucleobacter sp. TSB-Sco08W16 TaxID=1758374 RepID=UPI001BFECC5D|nr:hypothetical protein [Polynucleobacter sp. TSB-Sco08W16]QWD74248.1 hypothetical protein FD961_09335 [Polynucleobacter sp. TSB-Sco08W16]